MERSLFTAHCVPASVSARDSHDKYLFTTLLSSQEFSISSAHRA